MLNKMLLTSLALIGVSAFTQTVVTNPTASQNIVQPGTTSFSANNDAGIRYVTPSYNWTHAPSSPTSLTAGVQATVTLSSCPLGVDTSNNTHAPYSVYVAGTGTPEAVVVTGGTCTSGGSGGTVVFTPNNSHSSGYTVSSASGGLQEALNASGTPNSKVVIPPTGANSNAIQVYAPVFLHNSTIELSAYGASIQCWTRSACIFVGDTYSSDDYYAVRLKGLQLESMVNLDGVHITQIAISSNVVTVTTDNPHQFSIAGNAGNPDVVCMKFYSSATSFHGCVTLASVPSSTTFTAPLSRSHLSATAAFGWVQLENTAIEDNGEHTKLEDEALFNNGTSFFHHFIVTDNDQAQEITGLETDSGGVRCDSNYCGSILLVRGDAGNSGVVWLHHSNISLQCQGNGIEDYSGNGLSVSDVVLQSYSQYGSLYSGGLQNEFFNNTYFEDDNDCPNPYYSQSTNAVYAQAGVIHEGQNLYIRGGTESSGPAGAMPQFACSPAGTCAGSNERNYYIVTHSNGTQGNLVGPILFAGYSMTNGTGTVAVQWPQVTGVGSGTVTYDVLLTTGNYQAIGNVTPYLNNATSLTTSPISGSCSNGMCNYTDTQGSGSAYSYSNDAPQYNLGVWFWPAGTLNAVELDSYGNNFNEVIADSAPEGYQTVSQRGTSLFADDCETMSIWSPAILSCLNAPTDYAPYVATFLSSTDYAGNAPPANSKGRLNFGSRPDGDSIINNLDVVTLVDSNIFKTQATGGHRPVADAQDSAISCDNCNGTMSQVGIGFRAPQSLSNYINSLADGTHWLERLTSSTKTFQVQIDTTVSTGTAPFLVASTTPVSNLTTVPASYTASGTQETNVHLVQDSIALASGTATVTLSGSGAFTSATSFTCNAVRTNGHAFKLVNNSGTSFTITSATLTDTDTVRFVCLGY